MHTHTYTYTHTHTLYQTGISSYALQTIITIVICLRARARVEDVVIMKNEHELLPALLLRIRS